MLNSSKKNLIQLAVLICVGVGTTVVVSTQTQAQVAQNVRSERVVMIDGANYYVHTVKKGETIYSLSKLYAVPEKSITESNPQAAEGIAIDQVLKIKMVGAAVQERKISSRQQTKLFDRHTVNQGETAYSICKRYGISVQTLIDDNVGVDPTALSIGMELNIRKSVQGDTPVAQIYTQLEEYRDASNSVSTGYKVHLVKAGETLYSLSKQYGVAQDTIRLENKLADGLKVGMMIRIPVKVQPATTAAEEVKRVELAAESEVVSVKIPAQGRMLNVAMMLPLEGASGRNFLEFYQGALLALQDLKAQGVNLTLNLYNTGRSEHAVSEIVDQPSFRDNNIIIGPIYEECYAPVVEFARRNRVAVVSPLAVMGKVQTPLLYQMSPDSKSKYDKLKNELSADKNVVVVSMATGTDADFEREITPILPSGYHRFSYSKASTAAGLEGLLSGSKPNVFVVLSSNESSVDEFLARISSVQNNLLARSTKSEAISIIGTSKWLRFQNIDKNLYFKLGLMFVSSYHADRSNAAVMSFDKRYIAAYGAVPSPYSYRGYDAAKLFVGNLSKGEGREFETILNNNEQPLLQMGYRFEQESRKTNHVNKEWALVKYNPDYTVNVR